MSPESQRIAIAEACGWTNVHRFNKHQEGGPSSTKDGDLVGDFGGLTRRHLPNYTGCLNAMREAEFTAFKEGYMWSAYYARLGEACRQCDDDETCSPFSATASQRAEAFLRTLNLWKP